MDKQETRCDILIQATAAALNEDTVALMLVSVQKDNLRLSVDLALKRSVLKFRRTEWESDRVVQGLFRWWD